MSVLVYLGGDMATLTPAFVRTALGIADDCVRSEIELYARQQYVEGTLFFDTSRAVSDSTDSVRDLSVVKRALDYIAARGDAWPWRLKRHISNPVLVHFEDKNGEVCDGDH